jgi:hypothetical protein
MSVHTSAMHPGYMLENVIPVLSWYLRCSSFTVIMFRICDKDHNHVAHNIHIADDVSGQVSLYSTAPRQTNMTNT